MTLRAVFSSPAFWMELWASAKRIQPDKAEETIRKERERLFNTVDSGLESLDFGSLSVALSFTTIGNLLSSLDVLESVFPSTKGLESHFQEHSRNYTINALISWHNSHQLLSYLEQAHRFEPDFHSSTLVSNLLCTVSPEDLQEHKSIQWTLSALKKITQSSIDFKSCWDRLGLQNFEHETYDVMLCVLASVHNRVTSLVISPLQNEVCQRMAYMDIWRCSLASSRLIRAFPIVLNGKKPPQSVYDQFRQHIKCMMDIISEYGLPGGILDVNEYLERENDYRFWIEYDEVHDGVPGSDRIMMESFVDGATLIIDQCSSRLDESIDSIFAIAGQGMVGEALARLDKVVFQFRQLIGRIGNGKNAIYKAYNTSIRFSSSRKVVEAIYNYTSSNFVKVVMSDPHNSVHLVVSQKLASGDEAILDHMRKIYFLRQEVNIDSMAIIFHHDFGCKWEGEVVNMSNQELSDVMSLTNYDPEYVYWACKNTASLTKTLESFPCPHLIPFKVSPAVPANNKDMQKVMDLEKVQLRLLQTLYSFGIAIVSAEDILLGREKVHILLSFIYTCSINHLQALIDPRNLDDFVPSLENFTSYSNTFGERHGQDAWKESYLQAVHIIVGSLEKCAVDCSAIKSLLESVSQSEFPSRTPLQKKKILNPSEPTDGQRRGCTGGSRSLGRVIDHSSTSHHHSAYRVDRSLAPAFAWHKVSRMGGGRYSRVFEAINDDSCNLLAIKEYDLLTNPPELFDMIVEEVRVTKSLAPHKRIASYHGLQLEANRTLYLIVEYLGGGSLQNQLDLGPVPTPELLVRYCTQIFSGLCHLHSHGIVHRDVRPQHIMFDHTGNIKLINYYRSPHRITSSLPLREKHLPDDIAYDHGMAGAANRSPIYASPETVVEGRFSDRSDIWSAGAVILHMATGWRPWAHLESDWAIIHHLTIKKAAPGVPISVRDKFGPIIYEMILSCLQLEPHLRPSADTIFKLLGSHPK